ncbi:hypothetical protein SAMN04488048_103132 [Trichococcus flocculiformis]|nr:hypothetical protein [Trichococcus flocculiformis]CZQ80626.1 Hypothetical protein TES5_58 [Trichococcus sp. ES5]SHF35754.1 hypothetical protein SAMN04488048_103132 [Trichococcus flocculiformis]
MSDPETAVRITGAGVTLMGDLVLHRDPKGLVIFAHGSGSCSAIDSCVRR